MVRRGRRRPECCRLKWFFVAPPPQQGSYLHHLNPLPAHGCRCFLLCCDCILGRHRACVHTACPADASPIAPTGALFPFCAVDRFSVGQATWARVVLDARPTFELICVLYSGSWRCRPQSTSRRPRQAGAVLALVGVVHPHHLLLVNGGIRCTRRLVELTKAPAMAATNSDGMLVMACVLYVQQAVTLLRVRSSSERDAGAGSVNTCGSGMTGTA